MKLQNKQFIKIFSVRLRSVERSRLEDKKRVMNVHTNTPSHLKLDTTVSEVEEGDGKWKKIVSISRMNEYA